MAARDFAKLDNADKKRTMTLLLIVIIKHKHKLNNLIASQLQILRCQGFKCIDKNFALFLLILQFYKISQNVSKFSKKYFQEI